MSEWTKQYVGARVASLVNSICRETKDLQLSADVLLTAAIVCAKDVVGTKKGDFMSLAERAWGPE